jgi:hypothetical protein
LGWLVSAQPAFDECIKKPEDDQTGKYRRSDSYARYENAAIHIYAIRASILLGQSNLRFAGF